MEQTIFEPRLKFKPQLKFFKFGLGMNFKQQEQAVHRTKRDMYANEYEMKDDNRSLGQIVKVIPTIKGIFDRLNVLYSKNW